MSQTENITLTKNQLLATLSEVPWQEELSALQTKYVEEVGAMLAIDDGEMQISVPSLVGYFADSLTLARYLSELGRDDVLKIMDPLCDELLALPHPEPDADRAKQLYQKKKYAAAIPLLAYASSLRMNDGETEYMLADCYFRGIGGLPRDPEKACYWWWRSVYESVMPSYFALQAAAPKLEKFKREIKEVRARKRAEFGLK